MGYVHASQCCCEIQGNEACDTCPDVLTAAIVIQVRATSTFFGSYVDYGLEGTLTLEQNLGGLPPNQYLVCAWHSPLDQPLTGWRQINGGAVESADQATALMTIDPAATWCDAADPLNLAGFAFWRIKINPTYVFLSAPLFPQVLPTLGELVLPCPVGDLSYAGFEVGTWPNGPGCGDPVDPKIVDPMSINEMEWTAVQWQVTLTG